MLSQVLLGLLLPAAPRQSGAVPVPATSAGGAPHGLMVDFKRSPSLGVRAAPAFTWIVPPCATGKDHQQAAYQLVVTAAATSKAVWDSGKVASNASTYVAYTGSAPLEPGTKYNWTVTTWTQSAGGGSPCESAPSAPATFVTSLGESTGWDKSANFLSAGNGSGTFAGGLHGGSHRTHRLHHQRLARPQPGHGQRGAAAKLRSKSGSVRCR